ncbi:hypothetical protein G6F59_017194 [Rhizopus arrhizus]|nr:hypothetical protein G6F59_017194 [Rhizopus arrhizus]
MRCSRSIKPNSCASGALLCSTTCRNPVASATPARKADANISNAIGSCWSKRSARLRRSLSTVKRGTRDASPAARAATTPLPVKDNASPAASSAHATAAAHSCAGSMNKNTSLRRTPASWV